MNKVRIADWNTLVDRKPAHALVSNVDLVVIRYDDDVSVLYGRCLHRGALLADGSVEGRSLICGVHRWDYDYRTGPGQRAARTPGGRVLGDAAQGREHPRSDVELVTAPCVQVDPVAKALGDERLGPIHIGPGTLERGAVLQLRNQEREPDGHLLGSVRRRL